MTTTHIFDHCEDACRWAASSHTNTFDTYHVIRVDGGYVVTAHVGPDDDVVWTVGEEEG